MSNGLHTTIQRGTIGRQFSVLPLLIAGILMLSPALQAGEEPQPAPQQKAQDQQVQPSAQLEPGLQTEVQTLQEQIQSMQREIATLASVAPVPDNTSDPVTPVPQPQPLDERMQQLTRQRDDLARAARQLETQLQQLPPNQEQGRRWLQGQLSRIQGQLRGLDEQLATLQRQRLRADYQATLQARQQPRPEPERANQPTGPTPDTAKQMADLSAQLKQLQALAERNRRELEQIQDQDGPRARELQASLEGVRRQMQAIQDQLRTMERERTADKLEAADRQRQALDSYLQQLGRRQEELKQSVDTLRQELRAVQDQMRQTQQQMRAAGEESVRRSAQQSVDQLRTESMRQQEELRNQMRRLEDRLRIATERAGAGTEAFRKELDSLRLDLQRMGQTIGRIERERLDAQISLRNQMQQLEGQVSELRKDVALVQGSLNMMLSQMGRSTVGSAGCTWGW